MRALFRRSLLSKLIVSYLAVITLTLIVMGIAAMLNAPDALDRHMSGMGGSQHMQSVSGDMMGDLRGNLLATLIEVLLIGGAIAAAVTLAVSVILSRRIVQPMRAIAAASQGVAAGHYRQRVPVTSSDELGDMAQAFNHMAERLQETERRRIELIGNVAHELRTPLASLKLQLEGVIDGILTSDASALLDMQRELSRLQRLVVDLEDLSKIEAGQAVLDLRLVQVGEVIQAAASRLRPQYDDKGVSLLVTLPVELPEVRADANRIMQVLMNVLGNALHYTPAGGTVHLRSWVEQQEVCVEVSDTGSGIGAEHLPHIFERFYRVDKSRTRVSGGSGIGLTISRQLVEAHGGRIWASSAGVGKGSTVTFVLPLANQRNGG